MRLSGLSFRGFYPTRPMSAGRAARSVIAPYRFPAREICLLPRRFAPDNANIIANNQPRGWRIAADLRLREIMVRTKSRRMCRGEAGASEMRPYQGGATDLHPALSSPSATPLRSGGYAARLSELTERRRAQMLRRKTRLMEGEARDEGASAELSDMRRRGSSDAR